jgi:hypothetical protein
LVGAVNGGGVGATPPPPLGVGVGVGVGETSSTLPGVVLKSGEGEGIGDGLGDGLGLGLCPPGGITTDPGDVMEVPGGRLVSLP